MTATRTLHFIYIYIKRKPAFDGDGIKFDLLETPGRCVAVILPMVNRRIDGSDKTAASVTECRRIPHRLTPLCRRSRQCSTDRTNQRERSRRTRQRPRHNLDSNQTVRDTFGFV